VKFSHNTPQTEPLNENSISKVLNPDKPVGMKRKSRLIGEITNCKHQITNKFQMTTSKSQMSSLSKSSELVLPDLIRHPEHTEITGFWPSPEWLIKGISDFLRNCQIRTKTNGLEF